MERRGLQGSALTDRNFDVIERLTGWAADHGRSLLDLAVAWLLGHAAVPTVIAGATSVDQVTANVRAGDWELTTAQHAEIGRLAAPGDDTGSP